MGDKKRLIGLIILAIISLILLLGLLWKNTNLFRKNYIIQDINNTNQNENNTTKKDLTFQEILKQMFPDKNLIQTSNRQDCFYDKNSMKAYGMDNTTKSFVDVYCPENLIKGKFIKEQDESLAIIHYGVSQTLINSTEQIELTYGENYPTSPHAVGITHLFLGIFNKDSQLITKIKHVAGDVVDPKIYDCLAKKYITITSGSMWQGYGSVSSKLLNISTNGEFIETILTQDTFPDKIIDIIPDENGIMIYEYNQSIDSKTLLYTMVQNKQTCEFEKQ